MSCNGLGFTQMKHPADQNGVGHFHNASDHVHVWCDHTWNTVDNSGHPQKECLKY